MQGSYEAVEMSDQGGPETIEVAVYHFNIREFQPQEFLSKCFLCKVNTHIIYVLCIRVTMLKQGMVALEFGLIAIRRPNSPIHFKMASFQLLSNMETNITP